MTFDIKESFEKTRIAGSIAAGALDEVSKIVNPGVTTDQIDKFIVREGELGMTDANRIMDIMGIPENRRNNGLHY